jgi:hypothetical protein
MGLIVGLAAVVLLSVAIPVLDRLTDAPVMRRDVNTGTRWWRLRERLRRREDPGWPAGISDEDTSGLESFGTWRSRRRSWSRPWRN